MFLCSAIYIQTQNFVAIVIKVGGGFLCLQNSLFNHVAPWFSVY